MALFATASIAFAQQAVAADKTIEQATDKAAAKAEKKAAIKDYTKNHFKFYGFVRNYFAYDNRESVAGTGDLFYWLPKDRNINAEGVDLNAQNQFRFLSLTTRAGVDVFGYRVKNVEFGGKIEADFYAGLSGSTGTAQFRLRQAFATVKFVELGKKNEGYIGLKIGQAWHPMAADLPDIFSLESGAPFNAFSRTPQVTADFGFNKNWSITLSALWQMQYCSSGPIWTESRDAQGNISYSWKNGASADFIKYSCVPEIYLGLNYTKGGFLGRIGGELLSIKPRHVYYTEGSNKVAGLANDRITTMSAYLYLQYTKDKLKLKGKTVYSNAGEHLNLMSGYAVTDNSDISCWSYTPIRCSSTWVTVSYGKKVNGALLLGYMQNLGTSKEIVANAAGTGDPSAIYFQKNGYSNIRSMFRIQPEITYTIGKFVIGLEYMPTFVQYAANEAGKTVYSRYALATTDLHWIINHRVQAMVKFNF